MDASPLAGSLLALAAAVLYAVGGVMQHRAIARSAANAFDASGVLRGVRQPVWLAGLIIQGVAIVVQLVALGLAPLVVVQTIMVTQVFWVPLFAGLIERIRLGSDVWIGSGVVAVGVVGFVLAARPAAVDRTVESGRWAVATVAALACCAAATVVARRLPNGPAAAVLGGSAGILNVLGAGLASAALITATDPGLLLTSWLTYAAGAVLILSIAATAIAFAAGPVTASIPPMIAANPIVGALIGVFLLGQPWPGGPLSPVVAAAALAVMVAGIVMLSRTRALAEQLT